MMKMTEWSDFLNETGICRDDVHGNRPCDWGAWCDRCHAEPIQQEYKKWRLRRVECISDLVGREPSTT